MTSVFSEVAAAHVETAPQTVFLTRALNAVLSLQHNLSKESLEEAATASTDYMVLVNALASAPVMQELASDDPLAAARLRGIDRKKRLLALGGGVMRSAEVAEFLGLTRQAVDKRRAQNRLVGLTQGRRGYAYPRFQFSDDGTLPGLTEVLAALNVTDGWSQLLFFVNPNDFLNGRSPESELRKGRVEQVKRVAGSFGEQGAA
jgi:hypothetical protein